LHQDLQRAGNRRVRIHLIGCAATRSAADWARASCRRAREGLRVRSEAHDGRALPLAISTSDRLGYTK
jgi:hypothetical protein